VTKWSYEEFRKVWPTAVYGEVESFRFYNKLAIEKRIRETGTSVISSTKGKVSGRKRTPTKKAAEARQSKGDQGQPKRQKR
jgi:hypothetical protein